MRYKHKTQSSLGGPHGCMMVTIQMKVTDKWRFYCDTSPRNDHEFTGGSLLGQSRSKSPQAFLSAVGRL